MKRKHGQKSECKLYNACAEPIELAYLVDHYKDDDRVVPVEESVLVDDRFVLRHHHSTAQHHSTYHHSKLN
jgi:hypothetical protein